MNDESSSEELISIDSSKVDGEYVSKDYKTRFTLDLVSGNLQISNVFGTSGMTYFAFSDILGDHQIAFGTEMGMFGSFEGRVDMALTTVRTAVSVFEERHR